MLPNGNRLFDEVPKVLRDGWAKSYPQTKGMCNIIKDAKNCKSRNMMRKSVHELYGENK